MLRNLALAAVFFSSFPLLAGPPDNLVAEGVPEIPPALAEKVIPYLEARSAGFNDWHPTRREMLISTRFGDTTQLHLVKMPGGARKQLTFFPDRVGGGSYRPVSGEFIVFSKDIGGSEFFQLYRFEPSTGQVVLLTDGKSRNTSFTWADSGKHIAYSSTRRTSRDTDIYVLDPADSKSDRMVIKLDGGGWAVADWSPDDSQLLVLEVISVAESHLHLADAKSGAMKALTPNSEQVSYDGGEFSADGKTIFTASNRGSEFRRLVRIDVATGKETPFGPSIDWDVTGYKLSPDGKKLAFVTNENGVSVLHLIDSTTGRALALPKLPIGILGGIAWHPNNRDLGFTLGSAKSPSDAYSIDVEKGTSERWTESETGGLDPASFVDPELVRMQSFDGLTISAFVYRPDAKKFPGRRPALVSIHGGPEGQSRPGFIGRNNYYINELGIALVYPNVRGSTGYGKTFVSLDNAMKREDSVRDIGAVLDWIKKDSALDGDRIAVTGGSYGGYMTLASLVHFSDKIRAGAESVGISNWVTFLKNTSGYRQDLRRVEYGDEREEAMRAHLEKISPLTNVGRIAKPLFVVQGLNDPRVPASESEQIVKALRGSNVPVWYLLAKDEGHGFAKKKNQDYQFLATILFYQEHLLK